MHVPVFEKGVELVLIKIVLHEKVSVYVYEFTLILYIQRMLSPSLQCMVVMAMIRIQPEGRGVCFHSNPILSLGLH